MGLDGVSFTKKSSTVLTKPFNFQRVCINVICKWSSKIGYRTRDKVILFFCFIWWQASVMLMLLVGGINILLATKEISVAGETDLRKLLGSMSPALMPDEYVFCSMQGEYRDFHELSPLASYHEVEGLTLVVLKEVAIANKLSFESVFRGITLTIRSSLDAVGLTAAVTTKLAEKGISTNVIAAYYHDHIFVQTEKAELAIEALGEFFS
jgi:hypothetical protein